MSIPCLTSTRSRSAYQLCKAPGRLVRVIYGHVDCVQIDATFCLGFQAFHTGLGWSCKKQTVDQGIGNSGDASGVAAFLPGVTHHSHGFLMAHAHELFAVIVPHVGNVEGGVCLALLTRLVHIARDGDAARRTDDDTVRVTSSLLHELAEFLNLTSKVRQRDEHRHPAISNARGLCHTFGSQGGDENGNAGTYRLEAQPKTTLQIKNLAGILEGLPRPNPAGNLDVLSQARERWLKGHTMPMLDDTIAAGAQADDHPPAGELVEGGKVLRQRRRCPGIGIDNPRTELQAPRLAHHQRQYRDAVRP